MLLYSTVLYCVKHRDTLFFGMARNDPQVNLRLPADLKDQIEAAAIENRRTITAEVVARLQDSFLSSPSPIAWPDLVELLNAEAKKRGAPITIKVG